MVPFSAPFDFDDCQALTEGSALKKYKFLENYKKRFEKWKDKLNLRATKTKRKTVDEDFQVQILVSKRPSYQEARNTICFAGFYPHTAIGMIQAGLLYKRPVISQYVLENRCTKLCPGARDLDPDSLAQLWRAVRKGKMETDSRIDFGQYELPDVVAKCALWKEFNIRNTAPIKSFHGRQIPNNYSK